jgi:hypothetical protein
LVLIRDSNKVLNEEDKVASDESSEPAKRSGQFSLVTLLWCMLGWILLLAYAKTTGQRGPIQASVFMAMGLGVGVLAGLIAGRMTDRVYWSSLISILAYLAVAGGSLKDPGVFYGWGVVGSIWGAIFPNRKPKHWLPRLLLFSAIGGAGMLESNLVINRFVSSEGWFDVGAAMLIGSVLGPMSKAANIFLNEGKNLKLVLVGCLVASVLIGNWLVPILGGVNR